MPKVRALMISTILAFLAYGIWIGFNELDQILDALARVGIWGFVFICLLSFLNYFVRFFRWHGYLNLMGYKVPVGANFLYYIAGFALTTTPGKAGEAVRSIYLHRHGVKYPCSLAALVTERLSDLLSVLIIASAALVHFTQYQILGVFVVALIVAALVFVHSKPLRGKVEAWAKRLNEGRIKSGLTHFLVIIERMASLLGAKALIIGLVLGVISWGAEAYAFAYMCHAMGNDSPFLILFGIYALSMLAGAISFLPGGLGGAEVVMALLLAAVGMTAGEATSATLLCRLATLWLAVVVGVLAMLWVESHSKTRLSDVNVVLDQNDE